MLFPTTVRTKIFKSSMHLTSRLVHIACLNRKRSYPEFPAFTFNLGAGIFDSVFCSDASKISDKLEAVSVNRSNLIAIDSIWK
uniref:Uncharacterized protein n=1 Tax=Brugia timori TaxID=42155 RepID=A0A0R3QTW1_9BILA